MLGTTKFYGDTKIDEPPFEWIPSVPVEEDCKRDWHDFFDSMEEISDTGCWILNGHGLTAGKVKAILRKTLGESGERFHCKKLFCCNPNHITNGKQLLGKAR